MTVHFEVLEMMRGETVEFIELHLSGEAWICVEMSLDGQIKEIVFKARYGSADYTPEDVVYRFATPSANYTIKIEPKDGALEFMLAQFEDKLMPYLDKLKANQLAQEDADKIYGKLFEVFKDNLHTQLMFAVKDLFKDKFAVNGSSGEEEVDE